MKVRTRGGVVRAPSSLSIRSWSACILLSLAVPGSAVEDPSPLQAAKQCYRDADFQKAVSLLHAAVQDLESRRDVQSARSQLADAYLHLALSYCALGDAEAGKDAFRKLLGIDRSRRLDPAIYAPKVVDLFDRARLSLPPEPAAGGISAPIPPLRRLPRDRRLTVEMGGQQLWLSRRDPFAGFEQLAPELARGAIDLGGPVAPDLDAGDIERVRIRLPWELGDISAERRRRVGGRYSVERGTMRQDPDPPYPLAGSTDVVSLASHSVSWSRPFWSGTTLWRRPLQHRWELGYKHVTFRESVLQASHNKPPTRLRHFESDLSIHGARGGLATAIDLGGNWTLDLAFCGTLFFAGHEEAKDWMRFPLEQLYQEGSSRRDYGPTLQGQFETRLQWDVVRLRRGGLHLTIASFAEFGGAAGSYQPDVTIATRGVSAGIGLDLGPPSSRLAR